MKHQKNLFFKTLVALLLATAVLSSGMLFIAASDETSAPLDEEFLTPDVSDIIEDSNASDQDVPSVADKFAQYTFVTEEDGLSVVTIYSAEQVSDFASRRENGEWFMLTAEEATYLAKDTIALFAQYDTIRVINLDGTVNTYRGEGFYSSQAYLDCFGIGNEHANDSFNITLDIYRAVFARLSVLSSAVNKDRNTAVVYTDMPAPVEQWKMNSLNRFMLDLSLEGEDEDPWIQNEISAESPYGAMLFYQQSIYFAPVLSMAQNAQTLFSSDAVSDGLVAQKYDTNDDTVVVIEVWEEASRSIVASLRLDSTNDAEEVAKISALWSDMMFVREGCELQDQNVLTDYRVAVYVNGVEMMYGDQENAHGSGYSRGFRYNPDGNLDVWGITCGGGANEVFDWYYNSGSQELAEYINSLLKSRLLSE